MVAAEHVQTLFQNAFFLKYKTDEAKNFEDSSFIITLHRGGKNDCPPLGERIEEVVEMTGKHYAVGK